MRGLVRWWLAQTWTSPLLTVLLTTLPALVFCAVVTAVAPAQLVMSAWVFITALLFERVKPVRRLIRMRRYRAWARKQHRGVERPYASRCGCSECVARERIDAMLVSGAIAVTLTSRMRVITTGKTCGRCAAGMECELCR